MLNWTTTPILWFNWMSGWWFQAWMLFSISYMGCHLSHWRTHIFQDGWNHQPVIEPRKMEDVSCNLAILNMPYIYGRYLQSIGSCCMAIDGKPMVSVLENDRQMAVTACCKCGVVAPWSWPNMCKSCIEPLKILELEFTIFMFWLLSVVPFDTCLFSFFHVDILWDCKNYHLL